MKKKQGAGGDCALFRLETTRSPAGFAGGASGWDRIHRYGKSSIRKGTGKRNYFRFMEPEMTIFMTSLVPS